MRSRLGDGVVIVLLGLAAMTAVAHALPAPPDLQTASARHSKLGLQLAGKGRIAPRHEAAAP